MRLLQLTLLMLFNHVVEKSIEDITVNDTFIDHKTSDIALKFKMPNLISIDRLRNLTTSLLYNFVIYNSSNRTIIDNFCLNIYELNWDYLQIQNLGKGQLQITNMAQFLTNPKTSLTKQEWLDKLKQEAIMFYTKLEIKTIKRKQLWQNL